MKKRNVTGLLALALSAMMLFEQPLFVLASEPQDAPAVSEQTVSGETDEEILAADSEVSQEDGSEEIRGDEAGSEETPAVNDEETTGIDEEDSELPDETVDEEELSDEEPAESTDTDTLLEDLGFKEMTLTQSMLSAKAELKQVAAAMSTMKSDEDYTEHEVVFFADSEEEAEEIASCYGGTVTEYAYGVAVASIKATVNDAVRYAADMTVGLPAVYPNIRYALLEEQMPAEDSEAAEKVDRVFSTLDEADVERDDVPLPETHQLICTDEHLYATEPNDPGWEQQWYHETIHTVNAWNATRGSGITVAVIDTGIDPNHPDLKNNIYDALSVVAGEDEKDSSSHGTHCAGIIAAEANNSIGVSGVAPDAKILSIKAAKYDSKEDNYFFDTAEEVMAVKLAIRNNVDIISMSLGGFFYDALFEQAIDLAVSQGIVVVAAAGNEGTDQKSYPAAYKNVISVAATDDDDYLTSFSNYGSWIDIAAPGYQIYSTVPTYANHSKTTDYAPKNGTSMACPMVAGVIALMLSNNAAFRNNNTASCTTQVKKALISRIDKYAEEYYTAKTHPRVDAELAAFSSNTLTPGKPTIVFEGEGAVADSAKKNVINIDITKEAGFRLIPTPENARIYYTVDGKAPKISKENLYRGSISLDSEYVPNKVKIQAICVIGSKKSATFSQTYTFNFTANSISPAESDMKVILGKSIQLDVDFYPTNTSNRKLKWESSDTSNLVQVNNSGKVTCKNKSEALNKPVTITATTTDGSNLSCSFTVTPVDAAASNVVLDKTALYMSYWASSGSPISDGTNTYYYEYPLAASGALNGQYLYKSSNPKIAYVDSDGMVSALTKGSATITVTANDGSGKKATCKVTVVNPVIDIYASTNTGYSGDSYYIPIGTGCSITFKTEINYGSQVPKEYKGYLTPTNNKLEWTSDTPGVTVKNGKVTCAKNPSLLDEEVTITARAKDGFGTYETFTLLVTDQIKKMSISTLNINNGKIKEGLTSFTVSQEAGSGYVDLMNMAAFDEDMYYFYYDPYIITPLLVETMYDDGYYNAFITATITNPDFLMRDAKNYILYPIKKGTSKVTYTARDGSNKKFTLTIKVIDPPQ